MNWGIVSDGSSLILLSILENIEKKCLYFLPKDFHSYRKPDKSSYQQLNNIASCSRIDIGIDEVRK